MIKSYEVFGAKDKTWMEAKIDCKLKGGKLATIMDEQSLNAVYKALLNAPYNLKDYFL